MIGGHACLHTEFIHGGDIPFPTEHKLSRLTTPPIEYMLNGYDDSALNGVDIDVDVGFVPGSRSSQRPLSKCLPGHLNQGDTRD